MIISGNRYGSLNGKTVFAANESYGVMDMGRIMFEDCKNDMAIFNAVIMNDMHEIKSMREGTLLESELSAIREASIKEFGQKIIDQLKSLWNKIKGYIKAALANISAYVVRHGKTFVKLNRKSIDNIKEGDVVGDIWVPKGGERGFIQGFLLGQDLDNEMRSFITKNSEDSSASELAKDWLKKICPDFDGGNFKKSLQEKIFEKKEDATVKDIGGKAIINQMVKDLENGSTPIKAIKEQEKKLQKAIDDCIKLVKAGISEANRNIDGDKDYKGDKDNAKESNNDKLKKSQTAANALSSFSTTVVRAQVSLVKFYFAQCRHGIARAIGTNATGKTRDVGAADKPADSEVATDTTALTVVKGLRPDGGATHSVESVSKSSLKALRKSLKDSGDTEQVEKIDDIFRDPDKYGVRWRDFDGSLFESMILEADEEINEEIDNDEPIDSRLTAEELEDAKEIIDAALDSIETDDGGVKECGGKC